MALIHYSTCPVCSSTSVKEFQVIPDYSVSKEIFSVWKCESCSFQFTQDIPDQESIGTYYQSADYISHNDTKKGIINTLYHWVRKYTLRSKSRLIVEVSGRKSGHLLDIGAGTGAFLHTMKHAGWQVTGLEPDAGARSIARDKYQLQLLEPDSLFRLESGRFDVISMWHVLEHVHALQEYVKTIVQLLKQDGRLIVAVPNYTSGDATYYQNFWAAYDVPRHLYHFSPASMRRLMELPGLQIEKTIPMWFDSFYVSMLSENYKNGKPNHVNAFLQGWKSNQKAMRDKEKASSLIYVMRKT
ncbi:class I SAM-dependent methyltransferase [Flavihumibacter sp. UBA7668]|uniref:class I SAM-dependent methyltransferase n=1 Tax=Flavihumibacter sp. UBA7668 TaxID=1946542 RepID=UPI0025C02315|nr:class I SAM-dependent methyltransferase [Flavihumibacter sp. UBA7668]